MTHGILVKNSLGEVVLDNTLDLLCESGSGTSNGSAYLGSSAYRHNVTAAPGEMIAWRLTDGRWIAETTVFTTRLSSQLFVNGDVTGQNYGMISNAASVPYRRLRYGSDLPSNGAYGILLRDGANRKIFHSDQTLAWVADGQQRTLTKPGFNLTSFTPSIAPDWCILSGAQSGMELELVSDPVLIKQNIIGAVRRSGSSLEIRRIFVDFAIPSGQSFGRVTYEPDRDVTASVGVLRRS